MNEPDRPLLKGTLDRVLKWDWEKVALVGIITLAVANVLLFVRERREKGK